MLVEARASMTNAKGGVTEKFKNLWSIWIR